MQNVKPKVIFHVQIVLNYNHCGLSLPPIITVLIMIITPHTGLENCIVMLNCIEFVSENCIVVFEH